MHKTLIRDLHFNLIINYPFIYNENWLFSFNLNLTIIFAKVHKTPKGPLQQKLEELLQEMLQRKKTLPCFIVIQQSIIKFIGLLIPQTFFNSKKKPFISICNFFRKQTKG